MSDFDLDKNGGEITPSPSKSPRDSKSGGEVDEEDFQFVDPEEFYKKSAPREISPEPQKINAAEEDEDMPGGVKFIDPFEMANKKLEQHKKEEKSSLDRTKLPGMPVSLEEVEGEAAEKKPEEPKKSLVDIEELMRDRVVPYSAIEEEEGAEKEPLHQLDLGPLLKKKDLESPIEMYAPEEIFEKEEIVSKALPEGTVIYGRYKILKIISVKKDYNTYLVKDMMETGGKFVLHEIIPLKMDKEEYRNRKRAFEDNVRVLTTFKHKNMAQVYDSFAENDRLYYIMEYVMGISLEKLLEMNTKAFSEEEVRKWGLVLCDTITFMHDRPTPFNLGKFMPENIMVDENGNLKIIGYDLAKFMDKKRTLEFLPDDPKKLYNDITKLARLLFILLTKQEYDDSAEFPENLSKKMKKLLGMACIEGQNSIGYIRDFQERLEDTAVPEVEEGPVKKFYGFPFHKIDFSWIGKAGRAIIYQNPVMIALEIIVLVFVVVFSITQSKIRTVNFETPNIPITWISTYNELYVFKSKNREGIFEKPVERKITLIAPAKITYKKPGEPAGKISVLLLGSDGLSGLEIMDMKTLKFLDVIKTPESPSRIIFGEDKKIAYLLHTKEKMVSVIDMENLKAVNVFPVEKDPTDITLVPADKFKISPPVESKKRRKRRSRASQGAGETKKENENFKPATVIAVSSGEGKSLVFFDADRGFMRGRIDMPGKISRMLPSPDKTHLWVLMESNNSSSLAIVDYEKKAIVKSIPLPGQDPQDMVIDENNGKIWIAMGKSDYILWININEMKPKILDVIGREPSRMALDNEGKIWVLFRRSKSVGVLDSATNKCLDHLNLWRTPTFVCVTYPDSVGNIRKNEEEKRPESEKEQKPEESPKESGGGEVKENSPK